MAMNEDSVVSSLNELRRMANDRARRETEARARVEDHSAWDQRGHGRRSDGRIRATEMRGSAGGYQDQGAAGHSPTLMGGHQALGQAPQGGYGYGYGYNHTAQPAALPDIAHEPPRQKSAVGPVLLTIMLLGGAAGGGYWKLTQDFQAQLRSRDAALLAAEEARNKAVEVAARAEQLAKVQISHAEQRAKETASAPAPATAAPAAATDTAATAPAAKPAVAAKVAKAEKAKKNRRVATSRRVARAALPPVEEPKPPAMPKIAGKKKYSDDPLAGLKM
jgi:hypothetical protein